MAEDPTNGKAGRAVVAGQAPFQLTKSHAAVMGPFQLTAHQASLLLALESGSVIEKTLEDEVLQIHQHRPHWLRVIKARLYGMGFVVSAKSTRLGRIAARRALQSLELEAVRGVLRKEQAEAAAAKESSCDSCLNQEPGFRSCGHHWIDPAPTSERVAS